MQKLDYKIDIKVAGVSIPTKDMDDLVELIIDTDYFLPAMFELTLMDDYSSSLDKMRYADGNTYQIGAEIKIDMDMKSEVNGAYKGLMFSGEITSIEPLFDKNGKALYRVRGYDKSHRLTRAEENRTFGDGRPNTISEADIISKIAQTAGLRSDVDQSGISNLKHAYVMQYNQTDWDFLWARARRIGYQVYVEENTLYYCPANKERSSARSPELKWNIGLTRFEPRLSVMGLASESAAYGWDITTKKAIVQKTADGSHDIVPELNVNQTPKAALTKAFGPAKIAVIDEPISSESLAKAVADARLSARESNFIQATGTAFGHPSVQAGRKVKITGIGQKYSGDYYVTHARHNYTSGSYTVDFNLCGNSASTLYSILQAQPSSGQNRKVLGPVIGIVTDVNDPEKMGRIQVKYPALPLGSSGAELASNWARIPCSGGGKERGMLFLPEVDDEVLVIFEQGDVNYPYILGGLWNKKDLPPTGTGSPLADAKGVNERVIRSRSGHLIMFNDKNGAEQILIQDKTKENSILIDSKNNSMTLKTKGDFIIDAGGKFTVTSKGDVTLGSDGKIQANTQQAFSVDAKQQAVMQIPGNKLALSQGGAEISGMKVDVKGSTIVSINGNAMTEIKGALVKIN